MDLMRVCLIALANGLSACAPLCENTVITRASESSGRREAVVFVRACGATTRNSTQVALLASPGTEPVGIGNVLVLDDPVGAAETPGITRLRWLGADTLEVSILRGRTVASQSHAVEGVTVVFTVHSDSSLR
jgi:hypothetical protein